MFTNSILNPRRRVANRLQGPLDGEQTAFQGPLSAEEVKCSLSVRLAPVNFTTAIRIQHTFLCTRQSYPEILAVMKYLVLAGKLVVFNVEVIPLSNDIFTPFSVFFIFIFI